MDLLIFDCDGVLVDSEPIACEVVADVLAESGFPITREEFFTRFAGVSDRECMCSSRFSTLGRSGRTHDSV